MKAHLDTCQDCRATELLLQRTVSSLGALRSFEPSQGLRRRVLTEVAALPASVWAGWRTWFRRTLSRGNPSGGTSALWLALAQRSDERRPMGTTHRRSHREPLDVVLAREVGDRARLDYLNGWRRRAQGKGDTLLTKRLTSAIVEIQRELGPERPTF